MGWSGIAILKACPIIKLDGLNGLIQMNIDVISVSGIFTGEFQLEWK